MLTTLTLKNWRTHADTTLEFGKGTNVIIGVMGSGKSSIVNAISYSLFGTFPALKNKSVSLKEIVQNKPNQMSTAETILSFEQHEKKYRVERLVKMDGTNEAKLYENNTFIAGPKQKDVNEKIEFILGMDYELFSRAVYAEQNEMDFFLKLTPSERKKKFDELLQLEKYETARKNSTTVQNELLKEAKQLEKILESQHELLKNHEEEKLTQQIAELEKVVITLEEKARVSTLEARALEKEFQGLSEKEKTHKTLEDKINQTKTKIETIEEDLKRTEGISLTDTINALSEVKNAIANIKSLQEIADTKRKAIDTQLKVVRGEIKVLEYQITKNEQEMKDISKLTGNCPTCKQKLDEKHKSDLIEKIHESIQTVLGSKKKQESTAQEVSILLETQEKELRALTKDLEEKNTLRATLEAQERRAKEIEIKKKMVLELQETLPLLTKDRTTLAFDKKVLDQLREEFYAKRNSADLARAEVLSKTELKKSYTATLDKISGIKKTIETTKETISRHSIAAQKMGIFSNCLLATQGELRSSMLETINSAMTSIWTAIYPYLDFIDARLKVTDDGYDLEVLTRTNTWVRVEGILSGGERSAAALCIRMSFALVLTKSLSLLVLDEPTHNLDSTAVAKLATMLREEMPKLVEQIFVITHDKELESAASSNLYLLSRDKDSDAVTSAEVLPLAY